MGKKIYLVIHGDILEIPNPQLNKKGVAAILKIKNHLPQKPGLVVAGTGKRHMHVAKLLDLEINLYSDVVESSVIFLKIFSGQRLALLPGGQLIPEGNYIDSARYEQNCIETMLNCLPNNTVVIGGPITIMRLGYNPVNPGSVLVLEDFKEKNELRLSDILV